MNPETRPSLILRLGDPADDLAWSEFMQIYEPMLLQLASRWGLQEADAREVVQETLLSVANAIPKYSAREHAGAFRSWLTTITRNELTDYLSKRSRHVRGSGDSDVHRWLDQQADDVSSVSLWDWEMKKQVFAWAASKVRKQVSEPTWQAFYQTSVGGDSARIVAERLQMREGMVYVARSRVMSRLRKAVQSWVCGEEVR